MQKQSRLSLLYKISDSGAWSNQSRRTAQKLLERNKKTNQTQEKNMVETFNPRTGKTFLSNYNARNRDGGREYVTIVDEGTQKRTINSPYFITDDLALINYNTRTRKKNLVIDLYEQQRLDMY